MIEPLRVVFIHPDLGLGGAERLVVDAALELQQRGHEVTLMTASHDPRRAFEETTDGTLDVRVAGGAIPASLFGRLRAPLAIARMARLGKEAVKLSPDVVFADLVPHALGALRKETPAKILFYCHYPDLLLAPREGAARGTYRRPIDAMEAAGLAAADRVMANSAFTAEAFRTAFPALADRPVDVVHPGVDVAAYASVPPPPEGEHTIALVARYEPKKNAALAVEALAALRGFLEPSEFARVRLVVAGGYDARLPECRATYERLAALARGLGVADRVELLRSIDDAARMELLGRSFCLAHTAEGEHFGIAPVEAMAAARPVVAVDSGGPRETIENGRTGLLCEPTARAMAEAFAVLVEDRAAARRMGEAGRARAAREFARARFGDQLERIVWEVTGGVPVGPRGVEPRDPEGTR